MKSSAPEVNWYGNKFSKVSNTRDNRMCIWALKNFHLAIVNYKFESIQSTFRYTKRAIGIIFRK